MAIGNALGKAFKEVFSDVSDDVIEKASKEILENASEDLTATIASSSDDILKKVISHDFDYLGKGSFSDYLGKTSIFKNNDDFVGVISHLAKNGSFTEAASKTTQETVKDIYDYMSKEGQKVINKNKMKSQKDYQRYSTFKGFDGIEKEFNNNNFDDPRLKRVGEILNKPVKDLTWDEIKGAANREIESSYNRKATLPEFMGYHRVPQIATGVFGTAWLVNKMSDDRGQQTNAQLYNQEPY